MIEKLLHFLQQFKLGICVMEEKKNDLVEIYQSESGSLELSVDGGIICKSNVQKMHITN